MRYPRILANIVYLCIALLWLLCIGFWLFNPGASRLWVIGLIVFPLLALSNFFLVRKYCIDKAVSFKKIRSQYQQQYAIILSPLWKRTTWLHFRQKSYQTPWYLLLSHDKDVDNKVLQSMGFHQVAASKAVADCHAIQAWRKNDAIMIVVEIIDDETEQECRLSSLTDILTRYRPRQPLNGILVCQPLDRIANLDAQQIEQDASRIQYVIKFIVQAVGQALPCYSLFSKLNALKDAQVLMQTLSEYSSEGVLGRQPPVDGDLNFSSAWFDDQFEQLVAELQRHATDKVSKARSRVECTSILTASVQLKLLQDQLRLFLSNAFSSNSSEDKPVRIHFRGFFLFDSAKEVTSATDLVVQQIAYQFGQTEQFQEPAGRIAHPVFIKRVFNDYILPESALAPLNKKNNLRFYLVQTAKIMLPLLFFLSVLLLLKANYDYRINRDQQALDGLTQYRKHVSANPYRLEDWPNIIGHLYEMRSVAQIYSKPLPWWVRSWVPNPGIQHVVKQSYVQQLESILLPKMVHYLEDDLFAYLSLDESLETAKLLNLEADFSSSDFEATKRLQHYYRNSLIKEGRNDPVLLKQLDDLIKDTTRIIDIKPEFNPLLLKLSKTDTKTLNTVEILFNYLQTQTKFASTIDISGQVGEGFNRIFKFEKDFSGVLIPYLYTPEGFASLDLSPNSALFKDMLDHNQAVLGEHLSVIEKMNIAHNLRERYKNEYVRFWQTYIRRVHAIPIENGAFFERLALLAKPNSPLIRILKIIAYNTDPGQTLAKSKTMAVNQTGSAAALVASQAARSNIVSATGAQTASLAGKLAMDSASVTGMADELESKRKIAQQIGENFQSYQRVVRLDKRGNSPVLVLIPEIKGLQDWFIKSSKSLSPGEYYFREIVKPQVNDPFSRLSNVETAVPLIDIHIRQLVDVGQQQISDAVVRYLNNFWRSRIFEPFERRIAPYYPFSDLSVVADVNLDDFTEFFQPEKGIFDQVEGTLLGNFKLHDGEWILPGSDLLAGRTIRLNEQIASLRDMWTLVQREMFSRSVHAPSMILKLKPSFLSANSVRFQLRFSGKSLKYQHGPKLWQQFQWPDQLGGGDVLYSFTSTSRAKKSNEYKGIWALIRFIDENIILDGGTPYLSLQNGEQRISIQIAGGKSTKMMLFTSNFFQHFQVPERIVTINAL